MSNVYVCKSCEGYNQKLYERLSKYFDASGSFYKILHKIFERKDYFESWEDMKRHDMKKHGIQTKDSERLLVPSF